MDMFRRKLQVPNAKQALPGREQATPVPDLHYVNGHSLQPPFPKEMEIAVFGMGCFWGAERRFWEQEGIFVTAAGYAAGHTPNPTYEEVCSGMTGHNEVVLVVFDTGMMTYQQLLEVFWESHDPTQGMRQGNDLGTQYRSGIYTFNEDHFSEATDSLRHFQKELIVAGYPEITTEIIQAPDFYYAEHYHQQYLAKVPDGYCGIGGTGVCYKTD